MFFQQKLSKSCKTNHKEKKPVLLHGYVNFKTAVSAPVMPARSFGQFSWCVWFTLWGETSYWSFLGLIEQR